MPAAKTVATKPVVLAVRPRPRTDWLALQYIEVCAFFLDQDCRKLPTCLSEGTEMSKRNPNPDNENVPKSHAGDWLRCWLDRTGLRRHSFIDQLWDMTDKEVSESSLEQWLAPKHPRSLPQDPDLHLAFITFFYHKQ